MYQGRFKSFPVDRDEHLLMVCRYVERNPLRAKLVSRAANWRWGSLHYRDRTTDRPAWLTAPADCPVPVSDDWADGVDDLFAAEQRKALERSLKRGTPFGGPTWTTQTAARLGLETTLRPRGRPRLNAAAAKASRA